MSCKGNHSDICIDTRLLAHLGDALSRRSEVERFLSDFFNASTINLAIIDERLRYRMVNPYLAASHQAPLELHLEKHLREILGAVAAQVEPSSRRVFVTTRPIINCEISGMTDAAGDDTLDVELFPYLGREWESETRWRSGMDVGNDSLSIC